ncbi:MAG: hypothetical protein ACOX5J_12450 [Candidatus Hydrogenedentales bacterium]
MNDYLTPAEKPSVALLGAIMRARALGLHPGQIASVTGLTEAHTNAILASERYARAEDALQVARRLPLDLLDFDELLDAALAAMGKLLDDPKTSALTKLRIIEEIFDRDPTGALAKRTQPVTPANHPSPVFDNEAIRKLKERAMELKRENSPTISRK